MSSMPLILGQPSWLVMAPAGAAASASSTPVASTPHACRILVAIRRPSSWTTHTLALLGGLCLPGGRYCGAGRRPAHERADVRRLVERTLDRLAAFTEMAPALVVHGDDGARADQAAQLD